MQTGRKNMEQKSIPQVFQQLISEGCLEESDILKTQDGFWMAYRSAADLLARKEIFDFPDPDGIRLSCSSFFDDWFIYAVADGTGHTYSLLKLREQEHDAETGAPADGDAPGVTISFVAFFCKVLLECLQIPTDENRKKLSREINRVVAYGGQRHHKALKRYFANPRSDGAYLVAALYSRHIASFAKDGVLELPLAFRQTLQRSLSFKNSAKHMRLPQFLTAVNEKAGYELCDGENLHIKDRNHPDEYECAAILATHTGNTSLYSFAAEVEYHARFLCAPAKIKVPFFGRSVYSSAIRADMSVDDQEFQGAAPFYRSGSMIVKRQYALHKHQSWD